MLQSIAKAVTTAGPLTLALVLSTQSASAAPQ